MILKKDIYKFSWGYYFCRVYSRLTMWFFYRKIETKNIDNVPKNVPVILAINHQNALMDAMAFVHVLKKQPTFVARADIFASQFMANLLMFIKILPIFRMRDGAETLKNNEEVNDIIVNGLTENCTFGIMPEGSHSDQRKLRPLKKGIFRIAFSVQEKLPKDSSVYIVPVGLEYSDYIKCKSKMFVNFGKPIKISDYIEEYKENAPKTINKTLADLKDRISNVMIDIQQEELYEMFNELRMIYRGRMMKKLNLKGKRLFQAFKSDKETINKLNKFVENQGDLVNSLKEKVTEYTKGIKEQNLRDWVFTKKRYSIFGIFLQSMLGIITFPIHLFGVINNYLPYKIPVWGSRNVKDTQFISSFRYVILLITFFLFYIIQITLALIFLPELWMKLSYIIALPLSGNFAIHYYFYCKKISAKWRYTFKVLRKDKQILRLQEIRKEIIQQIDNM